MSRARDTLLSFTLVVLVFTGPTALAAYLLAGDPQTPPLTLAAAGSDPVTVAANGPAPPSGPSVVTGILHTTGTPEVDWNGVETPVPDGRYAYLGGESVSSGENDMGLLELDGDDKIYVCPGSNMSMHRDPDGTYEIVISSGSARFSFAPGTNFRIRANQGVYTPGPDAATTPTVVEVGVFNGHPGGVACGFGGSGLNVAAYPPGGDEPVALGAAGPGEVIDVSRALQEERDATGTPVVVEPVSMPSSVQTWIQENTPYPPAPGPIGYLCRCEELKRYAEAEGIPDAAIVPLMLPPDGDSAAALTGEEGDSTLPAATPAVPGEPNPADPSVLVTETPLTVPPPLVPVTGSGGGFISTPS